MGINVPILGSELLDSSELWNIAGKTAEGTIVSTVFDPKQPKTPTRKFVKEFKARLGFEPDAWAAQGYDAVRLLAYAIETSGSFDPIVIGTTLRLLKNWEGVTGIYSFQDNGGISGKTIFFKEIKGGNFRFLERQLREEISLFEVIEDVTLRLPVEGVITTIDPGLCSDVTSIEIVEQLFMGLTDFDPETYEAVPELAKEWRVSEDGKTYRFLMRNDVTWTDGKPVTAHDVVWAVQRNIKPETNSPYAYVMSVIKNAAAINSGEIKDLSQIGVRAIDDFTVEFELEHPAAYFPGMAGLWVFRPLPRDIIAVHGDQWTHPEYIQTNGSYRLFAWEKGMVLILRKNPMYFNAEKVSIPEVRYYVIPESTVGMAMYRSNQLDIMGGTYLRLPIDQLPNIMSSPEFSGEFFQEPTLCTYSYGFNTRRPPMDNLLVRKAISAAIDRKLLVQLIARGNESATTFTRPPVFGAVDPKEKVGISFDPLQARAWLAEAGYPDGQGFPEIEVMYNQSETHEKIARAIQTFLKHYLNINLKLSPQEWEDYVRLRGNPETHHLYRFGWCADYPDANNWLNELFHPTKSPNYPGWNNQEFGELMELAERETDIEKRKQLYKRAEQILCEEECVMLPIYFEAGGFLVKPRIKGWYNMALGGQHIRNWYLEEQ
jgi:ABC-type oligopeptide transport system substrate-binding subunit